MRDPPPGKEAWRAGGGVESDAIAYLASDPVQNELVGVFETISATSLEVERKHNADKRSETTKVTGVARASRNSILRRYLGERDKHMRSIKQRRDAQKKVAHLNLHALALERRPDLFPRARGKLRWETGVSNQDMRALVEPRSASSNAEALREYIAANRDELQRELARRRDDARFEALQAQPVPYTSEEWMQFLVNNDAHFRDLLRTSEARRAPVSHRIHGRTTMAEAVSRFYPSPCSEHGHSPAWAYLKAGFYLFRAERQKQLVCYVASIGMTVYACLLVSTPVAQQYDLLLRPSFHEAFAPIAVALDTDELRHADEVECYALDVSVVELRSDRATLHIDGAEVARPPARSGNARGAKAGSSRDAPAAEQVDHDGQLMSDLLEKLQHAASDED